MACFVTLTYSPEHLPESDKYPNGNLVKTDLVKFNKRFRKYYNSKYGKREIRFFAVGEYGDKSERAHFHIVFFGVDALSAESIVKKAWTFGHSMIAPIDEKGNRLKYTVGYTIKKMTNEKAMGDDRQPEFTLMSRMPALGTGALPKIAERLRKHNMYPSLGLSTFEKYLVTDAGYELKPFNGWFKMMGMNCKLDRTMMVKLMSFTDPRVKNLASTLDDQYLTYPKSFKIRKNRLHDDSKFAMIKFDLTGERYETQKQAEKYTRKHTQTKKI